MKKVSVALPVSNFWNCDVSGGYCIVTHSSRQCQTPYKKEHTLPKKGPIFLFPLHTTKGLTLQINELKKKIQIEITMRIY